jgi:tetratricopeptide (TPR) repeat protein
MNQATFENLMKFWKRAQDEGFKVLPSPRTASCLSFEALKKYAEGNFEAAQQQHVMSCTHCQAMARLFAKHLRVTEVPERAKPRASLIGIMDWITAMADRIGNVKTALPKPVRWGTIGFAAAAIIFLIVFLTRSPGNLRDLAQIEPYYFRAVAPMGARGQSEAEKLFLQGMEHYNNEAYDRSLEFLKRAAALDSTDAEFQFFLGVTYLLQKKPDAAIIPLRAAISLDAPRYEARGRWYLGNAFLLLRQKEKALAEFQAVTELGGEYATEARQMVWRIKALNTDG